MGRNKKMVLRNRFISLKNQPTSLLSQLSQSYHARFIALLFLSPVILGISLYSFTRPNYNLSSQDINLIGHAEPATVAHLKYNSSTKSYQLNGSAIQQNTNQISNTVHLGNQVDQPIYSLNIPSLLNKGITYYDDQDKLSFTLIPNINSAKGKLIDGRIIYPINNSEKAVYSVKTDGLKEDILLDKSQGNNLNISYTLKLPVGLEAKQMPGGAIGIYSANPVLYGNISYGSVKDQSAVEKARQNSPKNYLIFALTAPMILSKGSNTIDPFGIKTALSLRGSNITLAVSNLSKAAYPLTIDPSVMVASLAGFATGNNEGDITYGCANNNSICEAGLTGGSLSGSWTDENSAVSGELDSGGREDATTVAYAGYLYVLGGYISGTLTNTIEYAGINSNGTLYAPINSCNGSYVWCANAASLPTNTTNAGLAAAVYDGHIYIEDLGFTSHSIWDATIDTPGSNGAIGTFSSSADGSNLDSGFVSNSSAPTGAGLVAYNGYLYLVGGLTSSCTYQSVYYAQIKYGDGGLASWTSTTSIPNVTAFMGVAAYNGYLYMSGGLTNTAGNCGNSSDYSSFSSTYSIAINTNTGALYSAAWHSVGSALPAGQAYIGFGVNDGYLYVVGGTVYCGPSCSAINYNNVYYAAISSGGTLGSWFLTASPTTTNSTLCQTASVIYNNYIYSIGGNVNSTCSTTIPDVFMASIDVSGITGNFTSEANFSSTKRTGAALVATNGYLYMIGGATSGSPIAEVDRAVLSTSGSISSWATDTVLPQAAAYLGAAVYNGFIYVVGGCTNSACTTDTANVYDANFNSASLTWTTSGTDTSITTARHGLGVFAYNGYLYIAGGYAGSSPEGDTQYAPILANNGATNGEITGSWTQNTLGSQSLTDTMGARGYFGLAAYGGYVYIVGGQTNSSITNCSLGSAGVFYCNDVWHSTISNSGGLGGWNQATNYNFTTARGSLAAFVSNGYLYLVGGATYSSATNCSTGSGPYYCNDIQFIPITTVLNNTTGSGIIGWATTTSTAGASSAGWSARGGLAAVAYQGMAYIGGGYDGTNYYQDDWYAPINEGGSGTLTWNSTTANTLAINNNSDPLYGFSTVAYNGELYLIGGVSLLWTNSGRLTSTGSFTVPTGVYYEYPEAWGGGGGSGGSQKHNTGNSGGGGAGGSFSYGAVPVTPGNTVSYVVGNGGGGASSATGNGNNGNPTCFGCSSCTSGCPIWASGGGAGNGSSGSYSGGAGVLGGGTDSNSNFVSAGGDGGGGNQSNIGGAGGGGVGNMGTGSSGSGTGGAGSPAGGNQFGGTSGTCYESYLCDSTGSGGNGGAPGGNNLGGVGNAYGGGGGSANALSAGQFGSNGAAGELEYWYYKPQATSTIEEATINPDGSVGTFTNTTKTLATAVTSSAAVAYNGYLYVLGGANGASLNTDQNLDQYAAISSLGSAGTFSSGPTLNTALVGLGAVVYNGSLIVVGGSSSGTAENNVEVSAISAGTPGSFTTDSSTYNITTGRSLFGVTVYNGDVYIAGGLTTSSATNCTTGASTSFYCNDVQYIPATNLINASGSSWSYSAGFYSARAGPVLTAYNGNLYLLGGYNGTTYYNDTQYTPINSDGSIGNWSYIYNTQVYRFTVTSANATVGATYTNNGVTFTVTSTISAQTTLEASSTVTTPPLSSGTLTKASGTGDSTITYSAFSHNNFNVGRWQFGAVAYNGNVYVIGGLDSTYTADCNNTTASSSYNANSFNYPGCNDVQWSSLNSNPRAGFYSYNFDNGTDVNFLKLISFGTNDTGPDIGSTGGNNITTTGGLGGILIRYSYATNACKVFNAPTTINTISETSLSTLYPVTFSANGSGCSGSTNNVGEYGFLQYELDDSQTATFPDSSSNHSTISGIFLYYHPNPTQRLRGGSTFANGGMQALDTPP